VFTLALKWLPADQPLVVLGDDTLARKGGKSIALASMHHDPLLSSARKPFCSFGHVWVVLAVWVPLPFGSGRGFALPVLFRLYVGAKRGGERRGQHMPSTARPPSWSFCGRCSRWWRTGPGSGACTWSSIAPTLVGQCWRTARPMCR